MAKVIKREEQIVKFEFEISPEDFKQATTEVYKKTKHRFNVPGFRKGHAPKGMIENHYGSGVFYEEALNQLLPVELQKAIEELNIELAARADIDIKELDPKNSIVIEASAPEKPEFELGDYNGVEIEIPSTEATDEEVENVLKEELKKNARIVEVTDRKAEPTDTVIIDFKGTVDGEEFEGSSATNFTLQLGNHTFIEGFEEQIVGREKGEEFDVNVTFPDNYHAEELAGKDAVFAVKLHEIKEEKLPELDDDFIMDISEFDTVDEYKANIKEKIAKEKQDNEESVKKNAVLKNLADITVVDIHDRAVDEEVERMIGEFEENLSRSGLDINTYMQFTGGSIESLKEDMKDSAESRIKNEYILEKLVKVENIEISEADVETELGKIAEMKDIDIERLKEVYAVDNYSYFKELIAKDKAVELLVEKAKFKTA